MKDVQVKITVELLRDILIRQEAALFSVSKVRDDYHRNYSTNEFYRYLTRRVDELEKLVNETKEKIRKIGDDANDFIIVGICWSDPTFLGDSIKINEVCLSSELISKISYKSFFSQKLKDYVIERNDKDEDESDDSISIDELEEITCQMRELDQRLRKLHSKLNKY